MLIDFNMFCSIIKTWFAFLKGHDFFIIDYVKYNGSKSNAFWISNTGIDYINLAVFV